MWNPFQMGFKWAIYIKKSFLVQDFINKYDPGWSKNELSRAAGQWADGLSLRCVCERKASIVHNKVLKALTANLSSRQQG